jgi:hypothetical protein
MLKAKLAKYRAQLLEPAGKGKGPGEGFDVAKVYHISRKKRKKKNALWCWQLSD